MNSPFLIHYTISFLPPFSATNEVANLALPFAHPLNPLICSLMSLDKVTNSFNTPAISKSVGSFSPASNAR